MNLTDFLFIIPARGGSKGIPNKNWRPLNGKPLIHYSIELARAFVPDTQICLSSDDDKIIDCAKSIGMIPSFKRPAELATDSSGTYETLQHAVQFYKDRGSSFSTIVLLQPTSPFRKEYQLQEMLELYTSELDMLVSVRRTKENPYFSLFEENSDGYLKLAKQSDFIARQECPPVYVYNGAFYLINVESLFRATFNQFEKVQKYEMDELTSTDLDTLIDWKWAEFLLQNKFV